MFGETEKENIRQTGVILHTRSACKELWDDESEKAGKKRSRSCYVTKTDTPASRRRRKLKIEEPVFVAHGEDIARRNERERNRVRLLNESFEELREHIPFKDESKKKKLSKVEVLRMAVTYIQELEKVLDFPEDSSDVGDRTLLITADFGSESDVMDLSSDNRSRDDDQFDGADMEDSVDSFGKQYDENSLPPINQSFPGKTLPMDYVEIYAIPFNNEAELQT